MTLAAILAGALLGSLLVYLAIAMFLRGLGDS